MAKNDNKPADAPRTDKPADVQKIDAPAAAQGSRGSNRFIVGSDGKKQRVMFSAQNSDAAHSYGDAAAAGRRFKMRQSLPAAELALLGKLTPAEQRALLDMSPEARAQVFKEMTEVQTARNGGNGDIPQT